MLSRARRRRARSGVLAVSCCKRGGRQANGPLPGRSGDALRRLAAYFVAAALPASLPAALAKSPALNTLSVSGLKARRIAAFT